MTSKTSAQPSAEEIVKTFEKLVAQATTSKVSGWSARTLSRAVGWAALAERTPAYSGRSAKTSLLIALGTNPSCPPEVLAEVDSQLNSLGINDIYERRKLLEDKIVKSSLGVDPQDSQNMLAEIAAAEIKRISIERALDVKEVLETYIASPEWRDRIRSTLNDA